MGRPRTESSSGGAGSQTLDIISVGLLMDYYYFNPSATLDVYQEFLRSRGFTASHATLSRVLLSYNMGRGKPNNIPFDKWSDKNLINHYDYNVPRLHQEHPLVKAHLL